MIYSVSVYVCWMAVLLHGQTQARAQMGVNHSVSPALQSAEQAPHIGNSDMSVFLMYSIDNLDNV